jgi:hypothetical protein
MPALAQAGPAARQVMAGLQRRRLFTALPVVAVLTMVAGFRLMWIMSSGFTPSYFATAMGHTLAWSAGAAVVAFVLSLLVARPAALRSLRLAESMGRSDVPAADRQRTAAELDALRRRAALASPVAVALLVLAAAGMAVARYL